MISPTITSAKYQPVFVVNELGKYQLTDFLVLHDRSFVRAAYAAILRREPDPGGEAHYLERVRAGDDKAVILGEMLESAEAQPHHTVIRGLSEHLRLSRLCRIPIFGKFCAAYLFLSTIDDHMRDLRILQNHMIRIAEETQTIHEANIKQLRALLE